MNLEEFYQATTQLLPERMDMATDTKLPQYFIQSWQLNYMTSGGYETAAAPIGLPLGSHSKCVSTPNGDEMYLCI